MVAVKGKYGLWGKLFGAAGITGAACIACCASAPLLGVALGWLGLAGLGSLATGWYLAAAAMLTLALGAGLLVRRFRTPACRAPKDGVCGCATRCNISP